MNNDSKKAKEEPTLATLMRYFKKDEEEEESEQEDDQQEQNEQYEQYEQEEEDQDEQYQEHSFGGSQKNIDYNDNNDDDDDENNKEDEDSQQQQEDEDEDNDNEETINNKKELQKYNSSSNENSYYNDHNNDSDSAKNINIKIKLNQPNTNDDSNNNSNNKAKENKFEEREEEEEEEAFLKREEEKKQKAEEEKRKSEQDSIRYQNLDENKQNEIKNEMRKREEALRAKLKKSEEELKSELKKREESDSLYQSKQSNEDSSSNNNNDYYTQSTKPKYQPSFPIEYSKQLNNKDQRPSIQLRSKEDELKKSKNVPDPQKTIFDKFNEEVLKDKYLIDEKIFDELTKSDCISSKNINSLFHPALYNNTEQYNFQPEINEKSRKIVQEIDERNKSFDQSRPTRSKSPIELTLYDDAVKRREKLNKVYLNSSMNIKLNASKTKISNNSHKIAINKIEKTIDELIKKYEKSNNLSFLNVAQVLTELKIFRELLPKNEELKKPTDLKEKIAKVRERETRKIQEINFLEQIWFCLNPKSKEYLLSEIFGEFMKVLFSPVDSSITEIASILKQFLQAALFLHTNKNNGDDHNGVISPLTDKEIHESDLWPLEVFVKRFLELKENIIAYQRIKNKNKMFEKDLIQEMKKFSFKPKIENSKMRLKIFEKKLPTFIEREKLRQLALKELKKEAEKAELEQCTFKPSINKTYQNNESFSRDDNNRMPVYDKLYKMNKDKLRKRNQHIAEKEKEELQKEMMNCSFQPQIPRSNTMFDKTFTAVEKPKGYNKHIEHTRRGILENLRKKYLLEYNPSGENYEKMRIRNIKPFDITDMRRLEEKEREEMDGLNKKQKDKPKKQKEEEKDNDNDDDDEDYFTIQVKIPSGKERTLRIYPDDNAFEVATNFCHTYCIKDEVRDRLAANIHHFQNQYLLNHQNEGEDNSN